MNEVSRNEGNAPAFDELNLEEAVAMHEMGIDFECNDGHVEKIIEHYKW